MQQCCNVSFVLLYPWPGLIGFNPICIIYSFFLGCSNLTESSKVGTPSNLTMPGTWQTGGKGPPTAGSLWTPIMSSFLQMSRMHPHRILKWHQVFQGLPSPVFKVEEHLCFERMSAQSEEGGGRGDKVSKVHIWETLFLSRTHLILKWTTEEVAWCEHLNSLLMILKERAWGKMMGWKLVEDRQTHVHTEVGMQTDRYTERGGGCSEDKSEGHREGQCQTKCVLCNVC